MIWAPFFTKAENFPLAGEELGFLLSLGWLGRLDANRH